jgi:hypothetical protein
MLTPFHMILLVLAFVLLTVSAFWNPPTRPHLGWLGLAVWVLASLVPY